VFGLEYVVLDRSDDLVREARRAVGIAHVGKRLHDVVDIAGVGPDHLVRGIRPGFGLRGLFRPWP